MPDHASAPAPMAIGWMGRWLRAKAPVALPVGVWASLTESHGAQKMNAFRQCLSEITENGSPETHPALIAKLTDRFPHTIEVVVGPAPIGRYTCVMHAFDLVENHEYISIVAAAPRSVFASPRFVERLMQIGALTVQGLPREGSLVVYMDGEAVKHIGKLVGQSRVESKWGIGHLYRHELYEVPERYGSDLRLFHPITCDAALDHYVDYAREHGVRFAGDP